MFSKRQIPVDADRRRGDSPWHGTDVRRKSNANPAVFNKDAVYSATRITIAPILILLGLGIEIFAIFKTKQPPTDLVKK